MRVLVTGANGFVGSHLIEHLSGCGIETVGWTRRPVGNDAPGEWVVGGSESDFLGCLERVDAVVHAAGVAHKSGDCEEEMREGNAAWTDTIAKAVIRSEAKALIHISSIAAAEAESGATTDRGFYGRSKRLAETSVSELPASGKLGVNLRPPLIYGSGAKGNWPKLVGLAKMPVPLPFGSVRNRRSFLGISNLCELVRLILSRLEQPNLSGTFPVADDDLVSLREILQALRGGMGRSEGLFPFPVVILDSLLRMVGKSSMADGLFQDLQIDSGEVKQRFGWTPGRSTLAGMVDSVLSESPAWT